jgi:hypothetical protein
MVRKIDYFEARSFRDFFNKRITDPHKQYTFDNLEVAKQRARLLTATGIGSFVKDSTGRILCDDGNWYLEKEPE